MKNVNIGFWGFVAIVGVLFLISGPIGEMSGRIFFLLDRILYTSSAMSPVTMWSVLGVLMGLICGTFVSVKKYNLENRMMVLPIGLMVVVINLILLTSYLFS
ncbi:hypothetical protein SAMN05216327_10254 [Dyadobacter sp. SG02]|uniref:hypothetical protein n=1 Tax=Dyadobacter sp. SG02 TaxID=1855291 RepID=UPI0008CA0529|nr:hypothetical protein [Dyadobacter sp. SG02]SEI49972.1 hypothetical protein SAMN05216327_10254 [Dyadobacter sp. SG02]